MNARAGFLFTMFHDRCTGHDSQSTQITLRADLKVTSKVNDTKDKNVKEISSTEKSSSIHLPIVDEADVIDSNNDSCTKMDLTNIGNIECNHANPVEDLYEMFSEKI